MRFYGIEIETASSLAGSICQIGVAEYDAGQIRLYSWYVNPEVSFDPVHCAVHGIQEVDVRTSPTYAGVFRKLKKMIGGHPVVSHTKLTRVALQEASRLAGLERLGAEWINVTKVARRAWPDRFGRTPYGIDDLAVGVGVQLEGYTAACRALAKVEIMAIAVEKTGIALSSWPDILAKPSRKTAFDPGEPNAEGLHFGKKLVFTGDLDMPREIAAKHATEAGFICRSEVSDDINCLVVGDLTIGKNPKIMKARALRDFGNEIEILTEEEFLRLMGLTPKLTFHEIHLPNGPTILSA